MKVLLDDNISLDLRHELPGHEVFTVRYQNWRGLTNGRLLAEAAKAGFDVVITMDRGIEHQQNQTSLPVAVIVIQAASNQIETIRPLLPKILAALDTLVPNSVTQVSSS